MGMTIIQAVLLGVLVAGGVLMAHSRGRLDVTGRQAQFDRLQNELIQAQEHELKALRETVAIYKAVFDKHQPAADAGAR